MPESPTRTSFKRCPARPSSEGVLPESSGNNSGKQSSRSSTANPGKSERLSHEYGEGLRDLYEKTKDLIYINDLEWNILSVNPAAHTVLGYTPEELTGKKVVELVRPDMVPFIRNRLRKRLENPGMAYLPFELILLTRDGREKWFEINAIILNSPEGVPFAVQGIARDITDRKLMEEELRKSEQKYRSIFENTNAAMGIVEEDGILSLVNGEFEKLTGHPKKDVEGRRTWMSFVDSSDLNRMLAYNKSRMSGGAAPRNYEFRLVCKGGETKYVYITVAFIAGTRQRVISLTDLTAQRRIDATLKESESRYRAFLDATSDAAFMKDENLRYLLANRKFLQYVGFTKEEEILGKRDEEILLKDFRELALRSDRLALTAGELVVLEERARGRVLETRKFPVTLNNGKTGIAAIIRDVTEARQAEEEKRRLEAALERAGKMEALGTLAGGIAHDLNNVLGGMLSMPELLMMQVSDNSPLKKPLELIKKSGEKAAAIVQDMLTLARRGVSTSTVLNLNEIVSRHFETPEQEKLQSYSPDVRFETRLDDHLLNIMGSPVHLSKTLMNLLSNAAEAMPDGGTVTITTENRYVDRPVRGYDDVREGDYVVLSVSDTGTGIPAEEFDRIFEPFYTKKVMGRSGTGLGMTVVWGTVKDHNGYIDVRSEIGKGTTFVLYFPVTRRSAEREKEHARVEQFMGKGERILIVDDVPDQLELASTMLSVLGYNTFTASSGETALKYLQGNSVDLVVLDMIMDPGIDGLETYRRILEIHPGQRAIIASGYSKTERIREALKLGVGAYVKKPYVLEKIGIAVRDELERNT